MVQVDNKGIIDGLWRGDMICIGPKADDADFVDMDWEANVALRKYRWRE